MDPLRKSEKELSDFISELLLGEISWGTVDFFNPPKGVKTKFSHPYSYDPFTIWKHSGRLNHTDSVYSDRLLGWDFKKHDELCMKHFGNEGQNWSNRDPMKIQKFLEEFLEKPGLTLCEIIEGCNKSNGYPYWVFLFR
jgi:hypothetical protein